MASRILARCALVAALAAPVASAQEAAAPDGPKVNWTRGPASVDMGTIAATKLPEGIAFANGDDARKLLESIGDVPSGREVGLVVPTADDQRWFVVYEHHSVGFIRDDDRDRIDADALLASIKEGTEEANKKRKPGEAIHVVGWKEAPHYDAVSHHLVWAIVGRDDKGREVVNYNIRLLGRDGYVSATFVDAASRFDGARARLDGVLAGFSFKKGRSYAEWVPGDKVAEYGLTALVAAGAGAAAVKLGFFGALAKIFAKAGKAVVLGIAALGAGVAKAWRAARGKVAPPQPRPPPDPTT